MFSDGIHISILRSYIRKVRVKRGDHVRSDDYRGADWAFRATRQPKSGHVQVDSRTRRERGSRIDTLPLPYATQFQQCTAFPAGAYFLSLLLWRSFFSLVMYLPIHRESISFDYCAGYRSAESWSRINIRNRRCTRLPVIGDYDFPLAW